MSKNRLAARNTEDQNVISWVERMAQICQPEQVFWCDGSEEEKDYLTDLAVDRGILTRLNPQKRPG
jgi:phosphoenolpyruvate carboxykinase (GTP)